MNTFSSKLDIWIYSRCPVEILSIWCHKWRVIQRNTFQPILDRQFLTWFFHSICIWLLAPSVSRSAAAPKTDLMDSVLTWDQLRNDVNFWSTEDKKIVHEFSRSISGRKSSELQTYHISIPTLNRRPNFILENASSMDKFSTWPFHYHSEPNLSWTKFMGFPKYWIFTTLGDSFNPNYPHHVTPFLKLLFPKKSYFKSSIIPFSTFRTIIQFLAGKF